MLTVFGWPPDQLVVIIPAGVLAALCGLAAYRIKRRGKSSTTKKD